MKDEKVLFYTNNGETCYHEQYTEKEAIGKLKELGYKAYYKGRYYRVFTGGDVLVIVGINEKNTVSLEQRRKNGLKYARRLSIK